MKNITKSIIVKIQIISLISLLFFNFSYGQKIETNNWEYISVDSTRQKWGDWQEPEWLRYFGLDFTDVNSDGLVDIVSGRYIYHNPGDDMTGEWKRIVLDDNVDAILCVDIDDDPFADIIAQALPNIYWLEALDEEGTRFSKKLIAQVPATGHINSQGFETGQIIPGGKPEILIAGNGDIYCISIPENIKDGEMWPTNLICKNTSDEGIGIGDIDGDGDNDIACGRRPEGEGEPLLAVWYENPGTVKTEWESSLVSKSEHPMDRFKIADLNGDGKTEIIVTEERYPGLEPDGNMYWFARPEDLKKEWKKNIIVTQYSMNNLDVADIDEDGDLDLVTNEHKGPNLELQIWENDGDANFTKKIIDTGKENHLGTMLIDLDADGDLDIVGSAWDNFKWMHVWRNDSKRTSSKIYREYKWIPEEQLNNQSFLRVGGRIDYKTEPQNFADGVLNDGNIRMFENLDLKNAIGAEVVFEKVQSHNDTKGLCFQVNDNDWIAVYNPPTIKNDVEQYMFHFSPKVQVPLEQLKSGRANIRMEVSPEQEWNWPQNIFYGITLRIYYEEEKVDSEFTIDGIKENTSIRNNQEISMKSNHSDLVDRVEYIGFYEDVNWQGDGIYRQWQYNTHNAQIRNYLGTAFSEPFSVKWNTEWLPDQTEPMKVKARVVLKNGVIIETNPIDGIKLERDYSVKFIKPYQVPNNWVTRNKSYSEKVFIPFDRSEIQEAKMYWRSWSPCYSEGITVNGILVSNENDWPCYDYMEHIFDVNPNHLEKGENTISTLRTSLHDGQMVHGMEVQWPGIQMKVKKRKSEARSQKIKFDEVKYEDREHFRIETKYITYYFDFAGGGFSRMIDGQGNDWISFKMNPWGEYPASAASAFRGIPNLVFNGEDSGAGHPGHNKCRSWIEDEKIITESLNGNWKWQYSFEDDYVMLDVLKVAEGEKYWILYEGTPGGNFKPQNYTFGTSTLKPTTELNDYYKGETKHEHFDWIFNTCSQSKSTFFMVQLEKDKLLDIYGFLGNTKAGLESKDGMSVFGFGRGKETNPLLDKPQKFIFGLYLNPVNDTKSYKAFSKHIEQLMKSHKTK